MKRDVSGVTMQNSNCAGTIFAAEWRILELLFKIDA